MSENRLSVIIALIIFAIVIVGWITQLGAGYERAPPALVCMGSLIPGPLGRVFCLRVGANQRVRDPQGRLLALNGRACQPSDICYWVKIGRLADAPLTSTSDP